MIFIENIHIDDNVYPILLRLLHNKTGLNFEYYRRNHIEKRLMARMIRVKCNTLQSYYDYLFSNEEEFRKFLESFNINYTFFFRDWEVYDTFQNIFIEGLNCKKENILSKIEPKPSQLVKFHTKQNYLKNHAKKKRLDNNFGKKSNLTKYFPQFSFYRNLKLPKSTKIPIKIWSCPCASGEEPYTIAMILDNLGKQIQNFPKFEIIASDIDNDSILKAITGIYNEDSMKEITDFYKNKYFTRIQRPYGYDYLINEEVKNLVEFINEDVTKGHKKKSNKYDIIFFRYILIYVNRENRNKFINIIENRLNRGGLLILGKTETLLHSWSNLKLIDSNNQIYLKF